MKTYMVSNMARHLGQDALNACDFRKFYRQRIGATNIAFGQCSEVKFEGMNGAQGQI